MGKTVCLLLPLACLIGFLIGSWGAHDELRAFKEHATESKEKASAKPGGFDTFARMVKIPEAAKRQRRQRRTAPAKPVPPIAAKTDGRERRGLPPPATQRPDSTPPATAQVEKVEADAAPKRLSPEDLRARIEEAQELWRTRVDMARAQWKAKLKLNGDAEKAFDAALQDMNERLYDSVSALAGLLAEKDEMTPELGLRLVGETTTILAETYDKIGACAAPEQRDEVAKMQMTDFIDPGVAEPLVDVQGKIDGLVSGRRREE